ncbi:hypothetical protein BDW68DRAFT_144698 [Aspergillus falconensis]
MHWKDLNEFVIKQMRRPLYFGRRIARTPMTDYEAFVKMQGAMQPDRGGTIVMYEQGYPGGRAQLIADYDAAISLMRQTQDNRLHRRAITSGPDLPATSISHNRWSFQPPTVCQHRREWLPHSPPPGSSEHHCWGLNAAWCQHSIFSNHSRS